MPRIRAELADAGIIASRKRIPGLMRMAELRGVTTERHRRQRLAPDLVNRQFTAATPDQL